MRNDTNDIREPLAALRHALANPTRWWVFAGDSARSLLRLQCLHLLLLGQGVSPLDMELGVLGLPRPPWGWEGRLLWLLARRHRLSPRRVRWLLGLLGVKGRW